MEQIDNAFETWTIANNVVTVTLHNLEQESKRSRENNEIWTRFYNYYLSLGVP